MELRTDPLLAFGIASPIILIILLTAIVRLGFQLCPTRRKEKKKYNESKHEIVEENELQALRMQQNVSMDMTNEDLTRFNLNDARILSMITSIEQRVEKLCDSYSSVRETMPDNFDVLSDFSEDTKGTSKDSFFTPIFRCWNKKDMRGSRVFSGNFPPIEDEGKSLSSKVYPEGRSVISMNSLVFDAELVFTQLDVNNDGVLSYEELNSILKLNEIKVRKLCTYEIETLWMNMERQKLTLVASLSGES